MDVKSLYTLVAVADHSSFGKAAEVLGISISSVSLQVSALERETKLTLFDRNRRPPMLTDSGARFVEGAREVIASWERLDKSFKRQANSGVLRIGAVHTTLPRLLPKSLKRLQRKLPDLEIRLMSGLTHELEILISNGRLDVALVTQPAVLPTGAKFIAVCEEELVLIAPKGVAGSSVSEVLAQNPYVRFNREARVARIIDQVLHELGLIVQSRMEVDTLEGVVALVKEGLGVSIVPKGVSASLPSHVSSMPLGQPAKTRSLGLLSLEDGAKAHLIEQFHDELLATISKT